MIMEIILFYNQFYNNRLQYNHYNVNNKSHTLLISWFYIPKQRSLHQLIVYRYILFMSFCNYLFFITLLEYHSLLVQGCLFVIINLLFILGEKNVATLSSSIPNNSNEIRFLFQYLRCIEKRYFLMVGTLFYPPWECLFFTPKQHNKHNKRCIDYKVNLINKSITFCHKIFSVCRLL